MAAPQFRKMMIKKLLETYRKAKKAGVEIDEVKLIAQMSADHGTSERTCKEYIRTVKAVMQKSRG